MHIYELTKHADADLEGIARYTINEWGEDQASLYIEKLHQCFQNLASNKVRSKIFSQRFPHVFITSCEHHYVFSLHHENEKTMILAVLHKRMDLLTHLKKRLH
ncbi:type II toxin-antitoxin system RelE/ParE family toxin [Nitrospira sp. T9]|uniref:type II toxin-antitoxin system RelE/ParE family toxin n=1 Tax=unclassified Nitrospira TaxID=2652172 RepID=UPI003F953AD7